MIEEGECRKRTPMELLRAAIGEQKCEMPCDTLHDLHEDKQRNCKDRSCSECKVDALRKAANLVEAELDALKARALPEDMEWPTVDGTPVSFGERLVGYGSDSKGYEVVGVRPSCNWVLVKAAGGDILEWDASNCTRPILAADGEPIEVGQTVWSLVSGEQLTVTSIDYGKGWTRVSKSGKKEDSFPILNALNKLTHERPVLDADGVLCREGDEVWEVRSHRRREIVGTNYCDHRTGEPLILCDGDDAVPIPATCVTHDKPEPPDSWERIEEDARLQPTEYTDRYRVGRFGFESEDMRADLVRRARALAERGE